MDDVWDRMVNWNLVLPPSRPSAEQLARIAHLIQDTDRQAPVAVLGSTPEFRDLLFENGFERIFVLERNPRSLENMNRFRIYSGGEVFVEGDWMETLPTMEQRYALILSDLTSGNIAYSDRGLFYKLIANALRPRGIFSDKILTHPIPHIPLAILMSKYSALPLNLLHVNSFSCEVLFCSDLLNLRNLVDTTLFYNHLAGIAPNARVSAFVEAAKDITPLGGVWCYGMNWRDLEGSYCPDLRQIGVWDDELGSPYYGRLKHFALTKEA